MIELEYIINIVYTVYDFRGEKEYQYEVKNGINRCMKWENIKALLRLAEFNNRITEEQIKKIIDTYSLEDK